MKKFLMLNLTLLNPVYLIIICLKKKTVSIEQNPKIKDDLLPYSDGNVSNVILKQNKEKGAPHNPLNIKLSTNKIKK